MPEQRVVYNKILIIMVMLLGMLIIQGVLPADAVAGYADMDKPAIKSVFNDVSSDNPNYIYINYLNQRNIIKGFPDGSYHPGEGLTRAQAAVVIIKAAGLSPVTIDKSSFKDVPLDHWAAGYINAAAKAGYIYGFPDGTYKPDNKLTRAQAIALVMHLCTQKDTAELPVLQDMDKTHWAADPMAVALAASMIGLSSDKTKAYPDMEMSRGNLARALAILLTKDPELNKTVLTGTLKDIKGQVWLTRSSKSIDVKENTSVITGDIIKTGNGSTVTISYPDGSSSLVDQNTELIIKQSDGRSYIRKDGSNGTAVDFLNIDLKQGTLFEALATKNKTGNDETRTGLKSENKLASLNSLVLLAAVGNDQNLPWYKTTKKKVKVKVDMPWGVAAIRGTFIKVSVKQDGSCHVSCLTGSTEISGSRGTVNLGQGQASGITEQGQAPAQAGGITQEDKQDFNRVQQWLINTALHQDINQEAQTLPPVTEIVIEIQQNQNQTPTEQVETTVITIINALQTIGVQLNQQVIQDLKQQIEQLQTQTDQTTIEQLNNAVSQAESSSSRTGNSSSNNSSSNNNSSGVQVQPLILLSSSPGNNTTVASLLRLRFNSGSTDYILNGTTVPMDHVPILQNNRVMVPVKYVADALGLQATWDAATQTIILTKGQTEIDLVINSLTAYVNGCQVQLDTAPTIVDSRTFIPVTFVAEAFGYSVLQEDATGISLGTPIVLNFNQTVVAGAGLITLKDSGQNQIFSVQGNNSSCVVVNCSTVAIWPQNPITASGTYYLTIAKDAFSAASYTGSEISFTMINAQVTITHQVSGNIIDSTITYPGTLGDIDPAYLVDGKLEVTSGDLTGATINFYYDISNELFKSYTVPQGVTSLWLNPTFFGVEPTTELRQMNNATLHWRFVIENAKGRTFTIRSSSVAAKAGQFDTSNALELGSSEGTITLMETSATPHLTSIVAANTGNNAGLGNGDTLTLTFNADTNQPLVNNKAEVDNLLDFQHSLGTDYTGTWSDAKTLVIMVTDASGAMLGIDNCIWIKASGNLRSADGTSGVCNSSCYISGTFGGAATPYLTSIVAADAGINAGLGNGDTLTLSFNAATNKPAVSNKSEVDNLLEFQYSLGSNYEGDWSDAQTLVITVTDASDAMLGIDNCIWIKASGNLRSADGTSGVCTSSCYISGSFGVASATPSLTSIIAADAGINAGLGNGDTLTLNFNAATNKPAVSNKSEVDKLLEFQYSLGSNYEGDWSDAQTLVITVTDASGAMLGIDNCIWIQASGNLRSADGTSGVCNSACYISGTFGGSATPYLTSIVAADEGGNAGLGNGDTLTLSFNAATNQPSVSNKTEVDNLLEFQYSLGTDYTGTWSDAQTLVIKVTDASDAMLGIDNCIWIKASGNLRSADGTSGVCNSSQSITGSF